MSWGIFETDDPYVVHVAPCDDKGKLQAGHVLNQSCPDARLELTDYGVLMVVHEAIQ